MKLHLLSDLHLEFGSFTPPDTGADVVILAGDIHTKANGVRWAKQAFEAPVIYVPGNHEYYGGKLGYTLRKLKEEAEGSNVHVLDNEEIVFGGVRFLGTTLWTDYRLTGNQPLAQWDAQQTLTDFKKIRNSAYRRVRPDDFLTAHVQARRFLEEKLDQPFAGGTVVVTHHAVSGASIHPRYRTSREHLSSSYASNLEQLLGEERVKLLVHGHTHDSFDYDIAGTRLVCNPRGYDPDHLNPEFNPALTIEI